MTASSACCGSWRRGGKSWEILVRLDLQRYILAYLATAGLAADARETPLFQVSDGKGRKLTGQPLRTEQICMMVKRRLKDAGLPLRLSRTVSG